MKSRVSLLAVLLPLVSATACKDALDAVNLQSPDIIRVYAQPASIEAALGGGYQSCRNRSISTNAFPQLQVMSFESYSGLSNFDMGAIGALPRNPILNTKATQTLGSATFNDFSRFARNSANAVAALDRLVKGGGTLGTPGQNARGRAFGFFAVACNLTWLSAMYDSSAAVAPQMASDSVPPLQGYQDVAAAALRMLDSAIATASLPEASQTGGFPTPTNWMSGTTLTKDTFVRLMRSWKARIRTIVPRSKAERDAVNWTAVIADAENGITSDLMVTVSSASGWGYDWPGSQSIVSTSWHQIPYMILGAADATGQWDTWLATVKESRAPFVLQTPDLRWPQGVARLDQQNASIAPATYTSRPYIKNITDDTPGQPWGTSYYAYQRYVYFRNNGSVGSIPEFLTAEIDLDAAEGYIRAGNFAAAAAKIDKSRVNRGGLPAATGALTSLSSLLPGPNCVPRMPVGPNFTTTQCADIWEAMKYEKRMELLMNRIGAWFFDNRGWQQLYQETPLQYPVPVGELDARYLDSEQRYYNTGGGGVYSAPRSLFWFEVR